MVTDTQIIRKNDATRILKHWVIKKKLPINENAMPILNCKNPFWYTCMHEAAHAYYLKKHYPNIYLKATVIPSDTYLGRVQHEQIHMMDAQHYVINYLVGCVFCCIKHQCHVQDLLFVYKHCYDTDLIMAINGCYDYRLDLFEMYKKAEKWVAENLDAIRKVAEILFYKKQLTWQHSMA